MSLPVSLPVSLRARLVVTVAGLVALALGLVAGAVFGALQDWRGHHGARLLALDTPEALLAASDELTERVARVLAVSSAVALAGLTLLAAHLVRRGLRPLDRIVEAAADVGAGDLDRRIETGPAGSEVGRLGHALNAMLGQLERAFRQREESQERLRRFVADASHELRTPVATIRGYAELFRRGAASRPEDLAKAMSRIEAEAIRMGALVDEMLLLARLDRARPLERAPVELASLVADAVADTLAIEPDRPLRAEHPGPVEVPGDAARIRQAVGNLLANVLAHTPPGTPAVVRVRRDGGEAVIEVADEGPGLTEEQRALVFERFYRVEHTRGADHARGGDRRRGGAGLGLAIVAAVAAAHGGRAEADSGPGKGAVFRMTLPAG
ncbi:sensor histidine kinase [Planomonospora sphaerica]|uniref:sensor histidine kinase n=1 Tax=Planomonospora sphaerica TaxID=161355 RepID=UPI0018CFFA58|nr:HAMP domain-containing sensor histidine kinase [Planomonospora sphaerica]